MKAYATGSFNITMGLDLREEDVIIGLALVFAGQHQVLIHISLMAPGILT
jgi:hypothetical protein